MDKKITSLAEENKLEELRACLQNASNDELCQMIERKVLKGRNDTFTLVRAVLLGSPIESPGSVDRRCAVYRQCISALQKNELNNKMASELIGLLMLEADSLPGQTLAELAGIYIDCIKSDTPPTSKCLELLPKILSALGSQDRVVYAGNQMKGTEYKGHVLNSICSCRWSAGSVVHLAAMFKDVPLTSDELRFVLEKVLRMLPELDMGDIPALTYQLLLLSTKGHKKLVLEGVIKFFSDQDSKHRHTDEQQEFSEDLLDETGASLETLRLTEGTAILHISLTVKEHQDLGREFIKCLKSNQNCGAGKTLSPFSFAMALSLARINRFKDQIFDFLKSTVLKSYRDVERHGQSSWLQDIVPDTSAVDDYIMQTVQNSTYGWDHVIQGLVELGFLLMDAFGPKAPFGRIDLQPSMPSGPTHQACKLGTKILLKTFKSHEMVRSEILDQIFNRIITKATTPVSHFLELLGDIVMASPAMLLDSVAKVREMFDYVSMLSPGSAEGLLRAIQPLLKHSMALKDALMVTLRKAMFSRQLESRKIGASGFLMVLKHFRVLGGVRSSQASQSSLSTSQIEVDIHSVVSPSSHEGLCLEILGNLRRCLSQQADVRLLLYQGLIEVLDRNSQLGEAILSMLQAQLKSYYERNTDISPPLRLDTCIIGQGEQVFLAEPLAHLICCIQQCLVKCREQSGQGESEGGGDEDDGDGASELEGVMSNLTDRMITAEMEDFELDKSADYSLANCVGVRNNIFAILILGTYEALMEYAFLAGKLSETRVRHILQLYENYRKLSEVVREKAGGAGGKKTKSVAKAPQSLLSLKMVTQILHVTIGDSEKDSDLRESLVMTSDFLKYILGVALQKLVHLQDNGYCEGIEGRCKPRIFLYTSQLAGLLLGYYIRSQGDDRNPGVRERQIVTLTLEGLGSAIAIATQQYSSQLDKFLDSLDLEGSDRQQFESLDDKIYFNIKYLQRQLATVLGGDEDQRCWRQVGLLLGVIQHLCMALSPRYMQCEHIVAWLEKHAREQAIDDLSLVKSLLTMLLTLGRRWRGNVVALRDLAQDIHSQIGDIDPDIEMDGCTNFAVVSVRSAAPTVLQLVVQQSDQELDDIDWVISRTRAEHQVAVTGQTGGESPQLTQREGHEKSICTRLGMLVNTLHELVQTSLPVGTCTEHLLKLLVRIYTTLTSLVKYNLWMYTSGSGHMSGRFEKLVKLSGSNLTQHCYAIITYIQATESEKVQHAAPDKGKKKKDGKKAAPPAGKGSMLKQTRTIPNLVFAIEQYERFLIQLSKKAKVNLMEHMKHSTSRDFRINPSVLARVAEEQQESSGDESDGSLDNSSHDDTHTQGDGQRVVNRDSSSDGSDQENDHSVVNRPQVSQEPAKKRPRLGTKRKGKASS
ncbi:Fanconi anemia group I protein-like [Mya arenaria]|uniref:Fanconi anemia group I protein-like n=1 Tax=Mya arenaria TaxID=6604 RepID=UPI0022E45E1A|nr:Fanconi anemia group I protein-like [Mya arenaria]